MSKLVKAWHNEATNDYFTPKIRMVYPAILEPKVNRKYPNNAPKFGLTGLVPKSANIDVIVAEIARIAKNLWGESWKDKEVKIPVKKTAIFDKLAEYADEYPFLLRMSAPADYPPVVFGPDAKPLVRRDPSEVYGGRWAVCALNIWGPKPENKDVNRFVSMGLQRIQLLDHDEPIATGRVQTAEGFEAYAGESGSPGDAGGIFD